jgi:hypothetical protein
LVVLLSAAASDTSSTEAGTAKLNVASPRIDKAFRREIISVSLFSITTNLPSLLVAITSTPMPNAAASV